MDFKNLLREVRNDFNGLLQIIFGTIFLFVGILALFIPIVPGIFLILAGLYLLGGHKLIQKLKGWLLKRR